MGKKFKKLTKHPMPKVPKGASDKEILYNQVYWHIVGEAKAIIKKAYPEDTEEKQSRKLAMIFRELGQDNPVPETVLGKGWTLAEGVLPLHGDGE